MRITISLLFYCLISSIPTTSAQQLIRGSIFDQQTKESVENATVILTDSGQKTVIDYALSDSKGYFEINTKPSNQVAYLKVSIIGYATQVFPITNIRKSLEIALIPQAIQLKELVIKNRRLSTRGDTLNYLVSGYANVHDRSIGDVLKNMPGIDVQSDGRIMYNGKTINRFYIEGLDLLGGRYGLATNNISAKDIGSVQVYENHQPIKALKDISYSDQAAINLSLKDSAKAKWIGHVGVGIGANPILWKDEALAMQISPRQQQLNIYKTNNTGHRIDQELTVFTVDDVINAAENNVQQANLIDVQPVPSAVMNEQRTLFNKSHLLNVNNLWKINRDYQLRTNLGYLNDAQQNELSATTTYFLNPDSSIVVDELNKDQRRINKLTAEFTLTANASTRYLNNALKVEGFWDTNEVQTTGTSDKTQQAKTPSINLSNDFNLIKHQQYGVLKFTSFNHLLHAPQQLTVKDPDMASLFQKTNLTSAFSNTNVSLSFSKKVWQIAVKSGLKFRLQEMNSNLDGFPVAVNQTKNDIHFSNLTISLGPKLVYETNKLRLSFDLPVNFNSVRPADFINNTRSNKHYLLFAPVVSVLFRFNPHWSAQSSISKSNSLGDINSAYSGFLLKNYRSLSQGSSVITETRNQSYSASVSYRQPVHSFFVSTSMLFSPSQNSHVNQQQFQNIYFINQLKLLHNNRKMWIFNSRVSKGIDALRASASLDFAYIKIASEMIVDNVLIPFSNQSITIRPKFVTKISDWGTIEYNAQLRTTGSRMQQVSSKSLSHINQQLSLVLAFSQDIYIKLSGDHYYNQISDRVSTSVLMLYFGVSYWIKKNIEIRLDGHNLLNKNQYTYTDFSDLSRVSNQFRIRPCEILIQFFLKF